jgi:hypothetical protein
MLKKALIFSLISALTLCAGAMAAQRVVLVELFNCPG